MSLRLRSSSDLDSRRAARVRYDRSASAVLAPVCFFAGLMYVILSGLHPFTMAEFGLLMSVVATISAVLLLLAAYVFRRHRPVNGSLWMSMVLVVIIINSTLHVILSSQDWQLTNLMLAVVAAGAAVLATGWNTAVTVFVWFAFVLSFATVPSDRSSHWLFAMFFATLLSQIIRFARRRSSDEAALALQAAMDAAFDASVTAEKLRAAKEKSDELAASRSELLSTISHDIRGPVTGIVGMVDILSSAPLDSKSAELVASVGRSAAGLRMLLDNLLDVARAESGKLSVSPAATSPGPLTSSVVGMVGPSAQSLKTCLLYAVASNTPDVLVDPDRFSQVLLNVLSNAVKFTTSGVVTVVVKPHSDGFVDFCVSDTGPGIAPDRLAGLFEKFEQGSADVYSSHGGFGLGLAISHILITQMGGRIEVESAVGVGSRFHLVVPADPNWVTPDSVLPDCDVSVVCTGPDLACEAAAVGLAARNVPKVDSCVGVSGDVVHFVITTDPGSVCSISCGHRLVVASPIPSLLAPAVPGEYVVLPAGCTDLYSVVSNTTPSVSAPEVMSLPQGLKVVVADDDVVTRQVLVNMLTKLGCEVVAVSDGAAAVEEAAKDKYDLVLTDINMPVMSGLEVARIVKERLSGVGVVVLAADPGWKDRSTAAAAGFDGYIMKPFTASELSSGLLAVLSRMGFTTKGSGSAFGVTSSLEEGSDVEMLPVFDAAVVDQLVEDLGDFSLIFELVEGFLADVPAKLISCSQAVSSGSLEEVAFVAHSLKGSSGLLGGTRFAAAAAAVETAAKNNVDREEVSRLVMVLVGEAEDFEVAARQFLAPVSTS